MTNSASLKYRAEAQTSDSSRMQSEEALKQGTIKRKKKKTSQSSPPLRRISWKGCSYTTARACRGGRDTRREGGQIPTDLFVV